jgi:N-acetylglucosamine repressor
VHTIVLNAKSVLGSKRTICRGVGVSIPGLVHRKEGYAVLSPNLPFLNGRKLGDDLSLKLQLPVSLFQEEYALCLAEMAYGLARDDDNFAIIDVSAGLGTGIVSDGHFISGRDGFGGELGHITIVPGGLPCGCGNRGCLETVGTDRAVAMAVSTRLGRPLEIGEIIDMIRSGQINADAELKQAMSFLAIGVGVIINLFNPSRVFVYGCMFDAKDDLFDGFVQSVRGNALRPSMESCRIVRAQGNKRLGAVAGAIRRFLDTLGSGPSSATSISIMGRGMKRRSKKVRS